MKWRFRKSNDARGSIHGKQPQKTSTSQIRRPRRSRCGARLPALSGRRATAAARQVREGAGRLWKNCFPTRPPRSRSAARCTSAPASGSWKEQLTFLTPEEHYDYAISQLNTGYYEEAREQFNSILAAHPDADYAFYGLAVLDAITGRTQDCLANLARAIELNPRNRLQARVDNDFQSMVDDPRFTELLYPEIP